MTPKAVAKSSTSSRSVRTVLIADDHKIFLDGLRSLLEQNDEFECIGEAQDGHEAVRLSKELRPDIVVIDIAMPKLNGIQATREIKAELPNTRVIILSMYATRAYVLQGLQAGASAYLLKDATFGELAKALGSASKGEMYLSSGIMEVNGVAAQNEKTHVSDGPTQRLTQRELQVLQLIGEGKSTKEIAGCLVVSVKTVETHRKQIMGKLGIRSIAGLTKFCIREGLTSL